MELGQSQVLATSCAIRHDAGTEERFVACNHAIGALFEMVKTIILHAQSPVSLSPIHREERNREYGTLIIFSIEYTLIPSNNIVIERATFRDRPIEGMGFFEKIRTLFSR